MKHTYLFQDGTMANDIGLTIDFSGWMSPIEVMGATWRFWAYRDLLPGRSANYCPGNQLQFGRIAVELKDMPDLLFVLQWSGCAALLGDSFRPYKKLKERLKEICPQQNTIDTYFGGIEVKISNFLSKPLVGEGSELNAFKNFQGVVESVNKAEVSPSVIVPDPELKDYEDYIQEHMDPRINGLLSAKFKERFNCLPEEVRHPVLLRAMIEQFFREEFPEEDIRKVK